MKTFNSLIILAGLAATTAFGESPKIDAQRDWPWWRGPTSDSKVPRAPKPVTEFSDERNVLWKTSVPGRGHASPTVVGPRVFLATGDQDKGTQSVIAFDRETGKQLWMHDVNTGGLPDKIHPKNTHASSTIACDGERVFAVFYNNSSVHVAAITVDGNPVWDEHLGPFQPKKYEFGYGASPLIYEDTVIVVGDQVEKGFLAALDRKTGKIAWRTSQRYQLCLSRPGPRPRQAPDPDQRLRTHRRLRARQWQASLGVDWCYATADLRHGCLGGRSRFCQRRLSQKTHQRGPHRHRRNRLAE